MNKLNGAADSYFGKRLMIWCVRWAIAAGVYYWFWDYEWLRWTLIVTIPLGVFSLRVILLGRNKLNNKLEELDETLSYDEDEN